MQQQSIAAEEDAARGFIWVLAPFLAGALAGTLASYWDDAWHTNRGRDSFLIPPHILLYAGVAVAGNALAIWALIQARRRGLRAVLSDRPLLLAIVAVLVTLGAAPIDNLWHTSFGRDAVIWSPPHVLGIVGLVGLAVAVLLQAQRHLTHRLPLALALIGGAALIGATFLVAEYETDVPQFNVRYYLPVLCLATALVFSLLRAGAPWRWIATAAAGVHLVLVGVVALFLLATGWDAPMLPLLLVPALAFDLGGERGWSTSVRAAAHVALVYVLYVPWANWVYGGIYLDGGAVATGVPIAFAATWAVLAGFAAGARPSWRRRVIGATAVVLVAGGLMAPTAYAHDPGQGREVGATRLVAVVSGRLVRVEGKITRPRDCRPFRARDLAARRSHVVLRAPLALDGCRFSGSVRVNARGRWFLYADLERGGRSLETWLPVEIDQQETRFEKHNRSLYLPNQAPNSLSKTLATILLYAVIACFLVIVARLTLASGSERARDRPASA